MKALARDLSSGSVSLRAIASPLYKDKIHVKVLASPINPSDVNVIEGKYPTTGKYSLI